MHGEGGPLPVTRQGGHTPSWSRRSRFQHDKEGIPPPCRVVAIPTRRGGMLPSLSCLISILTRRGGASEHEKRDPMSRFLCSGTSPSLPPHPEHLDANTKNATMCRVFHVCVLPPPPQAIERVPPPPPTCDQPHAAADDYDGGERAGVHGTSANFHFFFYILTNT